MAISLECWKILLHYFKNEDQARKWLNTSNILLGEIPTIMLQRGDGKTLLNYLKTQLKNNEEI